MDDNLLEPIKFKYIADAYQFMTKNSCALCQGMLQADITSFMFAVEDITIECPKCGVCYPHTVVSKETADIIKSNERSGARELRPHTKPRPPEDVLKELGF